MSMRKVFVSYFQPIRFLRFEGKSVNRGLPVFFQPRDHPCCAKTSTVILSLIAFSNTRNMISNWTEFAKNIWTDHLGKSNLSFLQVLLRSRFGDICWNESH